MNNLHVRVKKSHILAGRRSSRFHCPVALAIREQMPGAKVRVQLDTISIDGVDYATPERAANFMMRYDSSTSKAEVPHTSFKLPKACPTCRHPEHPDGVCGVLVDAGKSTAHKCPCGNS